ncbi:MAG: amylo-alpha-1,6-glucosidase [Roseburia sp.]|nr:amylo-alpha-1,6-glucosidase [Roseburia sp.]
MKFTMDRAAWTTIEEGEKDCYLLTNGLGGYSSLSVLGSAARGDHALLMAAKRAPNVRWHLVTNVMERLYIDGKEYVLTSQRMKDGGDLQGYRYLTDFSYEGIPTWRFEAEGVVLWKTALMVHGENTVALCYRVENGAGREVRLAVTPLLRFSPKKELFSEGQQFVLSETEFGYAIESRGYQVFTATNAAMCPEEERLFGRMYFSQDERDGREAYGDARINHSLWFDGMTDENDNCVIFSTAPYAYRDGLYAELLARQRAHQAGLLAQAGLTGTLGRQLVLSADAYVVERASTNGKSIIAGYPFFEDWGRDTMISLSGITLATGRYAECRSILRTFAQYVRNGLLPNLFPEGDENPMYNSADAPLLFVNAVYEYLQFTGDEAFAEELWPAMTQIVSAYRKGTDFHIKMDEDGLIQAGAGLEQVTWMDVRVGDFLPTPRHGKPVEINAYWYSALRIMTMLSEKRGETENAKAYALLAKKVRESFVTKFWNEEAGCLKDVLSGGKDENQIRCNQIWALTMPFTMLSEEQEARVLETVREELYTTAGLRTLSPKDADFHDVYIGEMIARDSAYHQGTVWAFPLGAYYRARIRQAQSCGNMELRGQIVKELEDGFAALTDWLKEGCIGQLAEIYDGGTPTVSRGCFAQAWSVGELLRAVYDFERYKEISRYGQKADDGGAVCRTD